MVRERVAQIVIHMGNMGRHHLGHLPRARLDRDKFAIRFFQRGIGRGQGAVGAGEAFGILEHLLGELFGARPQQRLLRLMFGNIGVDRHPTALR